MNNKNIKYKIVSLEESCPKTGSSRVNVSIAGKGRTFVKTVKELYKTNWLEDFSKEDVAYLGVLVACDSKRDDALKAHFPRKSNEGQILLVIISAVLTSLLILANIGSAKIAEFNLGAFGTYHFPSSVVFFPLVFLLTDITTEIYGFKTSRKIIWSALLGLMVLILALQVSVSMPPSGEWLNQDAYQSVLGVTFRIFIASCIAFLLGDLTNAYILSRLKALTSGKHFFLRAIGSTLIGASVDSFIFINIAFFGKYSAGMMTNMICTEAFIKVAGEALVLPVTILLIYLINKHIVKPTYSFTSLLNPYSAPDA